MVSVRNLFAQPHVPEQSLASAVRGIRRMETVLQLVAHHFALMETMTTRDYLAFRDKLSPASGFQSAQMREIEILMGLDDADRLPLGHEHSYQDALKDGGKETAASRRVRARVADRPSLAEAIGEWLHRTPIQGSLPTHAEDAANVRAFIDAYCATHARAMARAKQLALTDALTDADRTRLDQRYAKEISGARSFLLAEDVEPDGARARASRIRAALVFLESYRELPLLAWPREVVDAIVAFEQAFVIFASAMRAWSNASSGGASGRGLVRGRLPRLDRAQVPRVPRRVGRPDAARPESGAPGAGKRQLLRVRGRDELATRDTSSRRSRPSSPRRRRARTRGPASG